MLFIQTRALLKQKRSTEALPRSSRTIVLFLRKGMLTSGVLAAEVQQTCLMAILLFGKQLYGVSFKLSVPTSNF